VKALQRARHMLPKAGVATAAVVVPLWIAAPFVIPAIYGPKFEPAVTPAHIILFGLVFDGVAGVITALLYGLGRPGLNSIALGLGLVVTVALDILLIPSFEATGGAIASACAYATTTAALVWFYWRIRRADRVSAFERPGLSGAS
jgi:O-antigen/teichoic acid export membrane protein